MHSRITRFPLDIQHRMKDTPDNVLKQEGKAVGQSIAIQRRSIPIVASKCSGCGVGAVGAPMYQSLQWILQKEHRLVILPVSRTW
jgi:hypothetical protein